MGLSWKVWFEIGIDSKLSSWCAQQFSNDICIKI